MKLADLPFGQRHNRHVGEPHALEEARRVFLVAADSIKRFRVDQIEAAAACILQDPDRRRVAPEMARSL